MILCAYGINGLRFVRMTDGRWISKNWGIKGPTGCMMNKEVPDEYAKPIEKAYQDALENPGKRYPELKILGTIEDLKEKVKPSEESKLDKLKSWYKENEKNIKKLKAKNSKKPRKRKKDQSKAEAKRKSKAKDKSKPKAKKKISMKNSFNPFEK